MQIINIIAIILKIVFSFLLSAEESSADFMHHDARKKLVAAGKIKFPNKESGEARVIYEKMPMFWNISETKISNEGRK